MRELGILEVASTSIRYPKTEWERMNEDRCVCGRPRYWHTGENLGDYPGHCLYFIAAGPKGLLSGGAPVPVEEQQR